MQTTLIKLGGSVVTRQDGPGRYAENAVRRLADEIRPNVAGCLLVHGTGHVGKPPALRHGYVSTGTLPGTRKMTALIVRQEIRDLNRRVLGTLLSRSIPAIPFDAMLAFSDRLDALRNRGVEARIRDTLSHGVTPVFHGDFLPCRDGSFRILSSDEIMRILARVLRPERAVFLTDVDGVYADVSDGDSGRGPLPVLDRAGLRCIRRDTGDRRDVSGGMGGKAEQALSVADCCGECLIANGLKAGVLSRILRGEPVDCTRVVGQRRRLSHGVLSRT